MNYIVNYHCICYLFVSDGLFKVARRFWDLSIVRNEIIMQDRQSSGLVLGIL